MVSLSENFDGRAKVREIHSFCRIVPKRLLPGESAKWYNFSGYIIAQRQTGAVYN